MQLYIAAAGLFLSWLIPLHLPPWVSWHLELFAFLTVFFLAWFVFLCRSKERIRLVSFPTLTLPFLGLILLAAGQFATGLITFGGDALMLMSYMTLCVICLTLGFMFNRQTTGSTADVRDEDNENSGLTLLATTLILGAFFSAVIAFVQVLDVWSSTDWINRMPQLRRPGGNMAQPNHLATLLLMGMVSLLFLYEANKIRALPSALILFVLSAALAVTESRTGVLSFLLLTGWWYTKNKKVGFRLSPWLFGLSVFGFIGFFWAWPSIYDLLQQTSGLASEVSTKAGSRLVVWPQLLDAVAQRPWWGWGLGDVPEAQNAVAQAYPASEPFTYSHNILLDLALGMGVPLTALLVLVTGAWLWRRGQSANQLLSWYCLAVVLPVAVHSMLEFPFAYAYFLVPVMFVLGVLERTAASKPALSVGARPAVLLLFIASFIGVWSVVEYVSIEEDFRVARFEALRVGQTPSDYQRPTVVLLTQLSALLDGSRILPRPGMKADELALAKNVALRYPWTATQNRYALSLALNGDPEEAIRQLRVMRTLHGEGTYEEIKANWDNLARNKYPQLRELKLP